MQSRTILYDLLQKALAEIKMESCLGGHKIAYRLSDLFQNIIGDLALAAEGQKEYHEVLEELIQKAKAKRLDKWLDQHMNLCNVI